LEPTAHHLAWHGRSSTGPWRDRQLPLGAPCAGSRRRQARGQRAARTVGRGALRVAVGVELVVRVREGGLQRARARRLDVRGRPRAAACGQRASRRAHPHRHSPCPELRPLCPHQGWPVHAPDKGPRPGACRGPRACAPPQAARNGDKGCSPEQHKRRRCGGGWRQARPRGGAQPAAGTGTPPSARAPPPRGSAPPPRPSPPRWSPAARERPRPSHLRSEQQLPIHACRAPHAMSSATFDLLKLPPVPCTPNPGAGQPNSNTKAVNTV